MKRITMLLLAVVLVLALPSLGVAGITTLDTTQNSNQQSSTAAIGGTFIVQGAVPQSTGTGVLDPFLRIQNNADTEQGYNTSVATVLDDKMVGNFTRALTLSSLAPILVGGVSYYEFVLDSNQSGNGPISLNQVQIFQANSDLGTTGVVAAGTTVPTLSFPAGATEVFRLNNDSTSFTTIISASNNGSGSGDMFLFVKASDFNQSLTNVILYAQFGNPPGANAQTDGFEEWTALETQSAVPDGGVTLMLLGGAFVGLETLRRRFRA